MRKTRTGFTLVELLVVMSLIAIVATMAILFFPNAATAQREANAAQQLQGWLNMAKMRAVRNQRNTGLRLYIKQAADNFFVNSNQFTNVVTECQIIEQPDDYRYYPTPPPPPQLVPPLGLATIMPGTPNYPMMPSYKSVYDVITITGVDLTNGYTPGYVLTKPNPGNPLLPAAPPNVAPGGTLVASGLQAYDPNQQYWSVQPCPFIRTANPFRPKFPYVPNPVGFGGDYLEVLNNGVMHQIIAVYDTEPSGINPLVPVSTIQIWPPLANAINPNNPTNNFRILRGPRAVGTETLTFPDNTFIDLNTNVLYNNPLPNLAKVAAITGNAAEVGIEVADVGNEGAGLGVTFVDILFSPSGQVITPGVATSNLHLWVRCPTEADTNDPTKSAFTGPPGNGQFFGSPTIVSVFVRTGFVGAYPPNPNTADPYSLVK